MFPFLSLELATPYPVSPFSASFEAVVHMQESTHKVPKSASPLVVGRMQLTLGATRQTPHGASRLVHAMSSS